MFQGPCSRAHRPSPTPTPARPQLLTPEPISTKSNDSHTYKRLTRKSNHSHTYANTRGWGFIGVRRNGWACSISPLFRNLHVRESKNSAMPSNQLVTSYVTQCRRADQTACRRDRAHTQMRGDHPHDRHALYSKYVNSRLALLCCYADAEILPAVHGLVVHHHQGAYLNLALYLSVLIHDELHALRAATAVDIHGE
jgi:hypothetical protein